MTRVQLRFNGEGDWFDAHEYMKENKESGKKVFSWTLWRYFMPLQHVGEEGRVKVEVRAIANDGEVQDALI